MRLSTHRLIIRRLIVLSSEIINTIVGPMRSGHWPKDATYFYNTKIINITSKARHGIINMRIINKAHFRRHGLASGAILYAMP